MQEKQIKKWSFFVFNAVFLIIIFLNFPWGKNLIGWDALNPELNFPVNFQRVFTAFWQENQGLGLLGGHGFAAVLPHNIIIFLLSIFLPSQIIRTVFTFVCYYLGGLGMFYLINKVLKKIPDSRFDVIRSYFPFISLCTSLFYLFNLGTIQMFYIQLEAFIFHFASLPWMFFILLCLLEKFSKKNLILFAFITFLASGQGFIPPLFVASCIALGIFLISYIISKRFSAKSIKKTAIITALILALNAYWLIPLGYYTVTKSNVYLNSYNNLTSTPEFINKNKKYGDFKNVALIKGFIFEALDSKKGDKIIHVFEPWVIHHQRPITTIIGYLFFVIIIIGIIGSFIYATSWIVKAFMGVFIFFFTGITTNFFPFSIITYLLQNYMPIYRQAFRAAFTKFSLGIAFSYSIFFALGIVVIFLLFNSLTRKKLITLILSIITILLLLIYAFPIFKGNLFFYKLKIKIPNAYHQIIDYFKSQGDGRIADFPQDSPEGWYTYNWDYSGSGFYWYGIKQPILSRTFDVWGNYNENYYWEITQALRQEDFQKVEAILAKYDVRWILYDPNILHSKNHKAFAHYINFENYLLSSNKFTLKRTFTSDEIIPISLYERNKKKSNSYIFLTSSLPNIGPIYNWNDEDTAYFENNDYQSITSSQTFDLYYPFRSLFSKRKAQENEFTIQSEKDAIIFQKTIPKTLTNYTLSFNNPLFADKSVPIRLTFNKISSQNYEVFITLLFPEISIDNIPLYVNQPTISIGKIPANNISNKQIYFNSIETVSNSKTNSYEGFFYSTLPNSIEIYSLNKKILSWKESTNTFSVDMENPMQTVTLPSFTKGNMQVKTYKITDNKFHGINYYNNLSSLTPAPCNEITPTNRNSHELLSTKEIQYYSLTSQDSRQCIIANLSDLPNSSAYLFQITARKVNGTNPLVYVSNKRKIHYLDTYVYTTPIFQTFSSIIPPSFPNEIGYDIYFDNFSQNNEKSTNDFAGMAIWQIPYQFMKTIRIENPTYTKSVQIPSQRKFVEVSHPLETYYKIEIPSQNTVNYLTLTQSYDKGWKAYEVKNSNVFSNSFPFLFGTELKEHILINNWANGWKINPSNLNSNIIILFLPQYLQYIGFALLIFPLIYILFKKN